MGKKLKRKPIDITQTQKVGGRKRSVADVEVMPKKVKVDDSGVPETRPQKSRRVYKADGWRADINTKVGEVEDALTQPGGGGTEIWNERDFIVPASSSRGEKDRISLYMMPMMKAIVEQIVRNRLFPYRSTQELIRHALLRHLHWLAKLDQSIPSTLNITQVIIDQAKEDIFKARFVDMFDVMKTSFGELREMGMDDKIRARCKEVRRQLEVLPDEEWRVRYLREFDKEFGHWVKEEVTK